MKQLFLSFLAVVLFITVVGWLTTRSKLVRPSSSRKSTQVFSVGENPTITVGNVELNVQIAGTIPQRQKGLSGVKSLGDDEGLLFVFESKDTRRTFWMKNMLMAIDIIWIDDDVVVQIDRDLQPPPDNPTEEELKLYVSHQPIDYVLEVAAGFSANNNISIGSPVDFSNLII